jgi:hypothetical protein
MDWTGLDSVGLAVLSPKWSPRESIRVERTAVIRGLMETIDDGPLRHVVVQM